MEFKEFEISQLFTVTGTKTTPKLQIISHKGKYPYITTKATENGVSDYSSVKTEEGNVLVVDSAVAGFMSYQEEDFSASDHVEKLIPDFKMNKLNALYICSVWNAKYCSKIFSYVKKANQKQIRNATILLPIKDNKINFEYIDTFINAIQKSIIKELVIHANKELDVLGKIIHKNSQ